MYSSGGDLHLELPGGETEGPQTLWQIPPYQTKSVMKANFVARMENNHTAYIRIKTNTTGAEFLYLPLEVEVSSQPGLYCPQEVIDFGLVPAASSAASQGPPNPERLRTAKLLLLNSGQRSVVVANVIATPVTEALSIKFTPTKVPADTMRPTVVAEITFDRECLDETARFTNHYPLPGISFPCIPWTFVPPDTSCPCARALDHQCPIVRVFQEHLFPPLL